MDLDPVVEVARAFCEAGARWDGPARLELSAQPLRLAELMEWEADDVPPGYSAEVVSVGEARQLEDGRATVDVDYRYSTGPLSAQVTSLMLQPEQGEWRVVDYLDLGRWRSTETCAHLNVPVWVSHVLVVLVMHRSSVTDTWTFVVINDDRRTRNVRIRCGEVVVERRFPPKSRGCLWTRVGHGVEAAELSVRRRWRLGRRARDVCLLPPLAAGHPRLGWCTGYSYWQWVASGLPPWRDFVESPGPPPKRSGEEAPS